MKSIQIQLYSHIFPAMQTNKNKKQKTDALDNRPDTKHPSP
jgi:hypothetical protein